MRKQTEMKHHHIERLMRHKITVMATPLAASLGTTAQELRTTYFMQTSDMRHEMNPALLDHSYVSFPSWAT